MHYMYKNIIMTLGFFFTLGLIPKCYVIPKKNISPRNSLVYIKYTPIRNDCQKTSTTMFIILGIIARKMSIHCEMEKKNCAYYTSLRINRLIPHIIISMKITWY